MTDITQADRDAAERLAIGGRYTCFDCADELALAFARCREAAISTAEPLIRADERKRVEGEIADRMIERADGCHVSDRLFAQEHYRTVAADIRAGDYRKGEA